MINKSFLFTFILSVCSVPLFAQDSWDFSDRTAFENWEGENVRQFQDGVRLTVEHPQSHIRYKNLLDATENPFLKIYIRTIGEQNRNGFVHWQNKFERKRHRIKFNTKGSGEQVIKLNMKQSADWIGEVKNFSISPSDKKEKIIIQKVEFYQRVELKNAKMEWVDDLDVELTLRIPKKPIMIYVFEVGEPDSRKMRKEIFKDPEIAYHLQDYYCIRFLAEETSRYQKYIGTVAKVPLMVFLEYKPKKESLEIINRIEGFHTKEQMLRYLEVIRKEWK